MQYHKHLYYRGGESILGLKAHACILQCECAQGNRRQLAIFPRLHTHINTRGTSCVLQLTSLIVNSCWCARGHACTLRFLRVFFFFFLMFETCWLLGRRRSPRSAEMYGGFVLSVCARIQQLFKIHFLLFDPPDISLRGSPSPRDVRVDMPPGLTALVCCMDDGEWYIVWVNHRLGGVVKRHVKMDAC